jgi:Protein of unknown function (DUF3443)
VAYLTALCACGGGGAGSTGGTPQPTLPTGSNVAPLIVDAGPKQVGINLPSVSVTICAPNTSSCQTIDHILVDTGSEGLRIFASVLNSTLVLPAATTATNEPMYECYRFADGDSWGSVRLADVQLADGKASKLKVQLIGDPAAPAAPAGCNATQDTVDAFNANGVLGIDVFLTDCGDGCNLATDPGGGLYFVCPTGQCAGSLTSPAAQVLNPIGQFATDNNGVEIFLPPLPATGQRTAAGALVLGIDTQSNNQLSGAVVISVGAQTGNFTTVYGGHSYTEGGFVDSGSNGNFFADTTLTQCTVNAGWYCPATAASRSATNQGVGTSSASSTVTFSVASLDALSNANPSFAAFANIAGTNSVNGFDWGLPFFFGRRLAVAVEGQSTSAGAGPFIAYADF